jgi:asparagine synthase (glutamine-hydrolysing)
MDRVVLARNTAMGLRPHYFHEAGAVHSASIRRLFAEHPELPREIDLTGLRQYFDRQPDGLHSCFQGVSPVPSGMELRMRDGSMVLSKAELPDPCGRSLIGLLELAVEDLLARSRRPAFALSGGLDSALLLAVLRRSGRLAPVYTLVTSIPGYCEQGVTLDTARVLGEDDVREIPVSAEDFVAALPEAIAACETPLYNLHSVSKWLLARELHNRGFDMVITGDGADQVFAGSDGRNYLPIVGAMVRAAGITLGSPFLDERVMGLARVIGVDANKSGLRAAAAALLPEQICERRKTPCLMPDLDLSLFRDAQADAMLAGLLQMAPPGNSPSPGETLWRTATLLLQRFGEIG